MTKQNSRYRFYISLRLDLLSLNNYFTKYSDKIKVKIEHISIMHDMTFFEEK